MMNSERVPSTHAPALGVAMYLLLAILSGAPLASCTERSAGALRDGDIVFQRSESGQAAAIAAATHSDYTHMGVVFVEQGVPYVYEAVQPVQRAPLKDWIARGRGGQYAAKRLKDTSGLEPERLKQEVGAMMGKDYDWLFDWSDQRIYCSEMVWKAYKRGLGIELGKLRQLRDFDLDHPAVRQALHETYGENVPMDMDVIAPSDIFGSDLLQTVAD